MQADALPVRSVVLDVGTAVTKAGFAGEEAPRERFHSCVGTTRHAALPATQLQYPTNIVAGEEAYEHYGLLHLRRPVQRGQLGDADAMEQLLLYTLYDKLQVVPEQTTTLLLEPADRTRKDRERIAELFFESINLSLLGMLNTSTATVYATGRTTGLVVDSGAGKTMINAVSDGYAMAHAMRPSFLAGDCLTDTLMHALRARGYPLSTVGDWRTVERIKERLCRVSLHVGEDERLVAEHGPPRDVFYSLPDKERVFLFESEFVVPECLFDPLRLPEAIVAQHGPELVRPITPTGYSHGLKSNSNSNNTNEKEKCKGWVETIEEVIAACPASMHGELYNNVVLGGGTTMLREMECRLQQDLTLRQPTQAVRCVAFAERAYAAWLGGSVWASSPCFAHLCLSKADYHETGPSIVHEFAN